MSYSKEFNEEKYGEIQSYLSQLEELEEGKVLSISFSSQEEAEKARWLFYDYFHLLALSKVFKLTLFTNLLLVGKRRPTLSNVTSSSKKEGISSQLDKLIQQLLASPAPRQLALTILQDKSISLTSLSIILGEVGRVLEN